MGADKIAIPAALASGFKELLELLYKGGVAIGKLADQAAKLKMLSEETELNLSSLQKVDYAAQLKGLEFDKIQEDLPKLVEKYKEKAEAEGKSFEQFLIDLSKDEQVEKLDLNRETVRLLKNNSVISLQEAFDKVKDNNLVRSDDEIAQLVELSYAVNSLKATTNSVGSGYLAGNSNALKSLSKGTEDMLLGRLPRQSNKDIPLWRTDRMVMTRGVTPYEHTPLDPVEMWNEVMQHSPRPYDFGPERREKAEQVSQWSDTVIGALSKFSEKLNQVSEQLMPFAGWLAGIARQMSDIPPPTQAEIDDLINAPNVFSRGIWRAKQKLKHAAAGLRLDFPPELGYV